jgi:hypothetical protein
VLRILIASFKVLGLTGVAFAVGGLLVWCATARSEDFYLRTSFKSGSVASFWIRPMLEKEQKLKGAFSQADVSVWLNSGRTEAAFSRFDNWWQELLLLSEESDEEAGSENQILPSFPLNPEADDTDETEFLIEDSYDLALAELLEDIWTSGFLTFAGSVHFKVPVWAKPLAGLSGVLAQSGMSSSLVDAFADNFPLRQDALDLPSWLVTIPFSNVVNQKSPVQDLVLDLGGRELSELFARLCDLENLSEKYCEVEEAETNPLTPLFLTSEGFHVQLKFYWALRGQHIVWSNSKECLEDLISQPAGTRFRCGDFPAAGGSHTEHEFKQLMNYKNISDAGNIRASGVWFNQKSLHLSMNKMIGDLNPDLSAGLARLLEFLNFGRRDNAFLFIQNALTEWAYLWPLWGAEIGREDTASGKLFIHALRAVRPKPQEILQPRIAVNQFSFFNSVLNAWLGLANSTTRLVQSKPWAQENGYWRAESDYRFGWSEQE